MGKKFTFGKFNGWDVDELAQTFAGREYLSWCASNLSNSAWRAECAAALARNGEINEALAARAEMHAEPDLSPEDALNSVRERLEQERDDRAFFARMDAEKAAIFEKYAALAGKSASELRSAATTLGRLGDWHTIPQSRFSSPALRNHLVAMMDELAEIGLSW